MPRAAKKVWWSGAAFWAAFDAQRNEYPGPDARLQVYKENGHTVVRIADATGNGGDPIDDSHVCPPFC
jgi:hypothetical protein